jgi:hypothetical protein
LLAQAFYAHTSIVKVCRYEFHFSYS